METHDEEMARLRQQDAVVLDQALTWLRTFWYANRTRDAADLPRDHEQARYETLRAIRAMLDLLDG